MGYAADAGRSGEPVMKSSMGGEVNGLWRWYGVSVRCSPVACVRYVGHSVYTCLINISL